MGRVMVVPAAALAFLVGEAVARPDSPPPAVVAPAAAPARPPASPAAAPLAAAERGKPTDEAQIALTDGQRTVAALRKGLAEIEALMRYAARSGEGFRVHCVARRVAAARSMVGLGDASVVAAQQAIRDQDTAELQYQLGRLRMLGDKMRWEKGDARICVEDDLSSVQTLQRGLDIYPDPPSPDPASAPPPAGSPPLPEPPL
jgi:hypothetical protein